MQSLQLELPKSAIWPPGIVNKSEVILLRFCENIVPLIISELSLEKADVKIFSPYLTGDVAFDIASLARVVKVYTLLNVEVLASGGSEYKTLRRLLDEKITLFRVPRLHAKMVVAEGRFITIGSQNLTVNGERRNKEVNVKLGSAPVKALQLISKIEAAGELVTLELLDYIKGQADKLAARYENLKLELSAAEKKVNAYALGTSGVDGGRTRLDAGVVRSIGEKPRSNPRRCSIVSRYDDKNLGWKHSLKGGELLEWEISQKIIRLRPQYRYLCISKTGSIGWVRVNNTVYSFIENEVGFVPGSLPINVKWEVFLSAGQDAGRKLIGGERTNLLVTIKSFGLELCRVFIRYDINEVKACQPLMPSRISDSKASVMESKQAIKVINNNVATFEAQIKSLVTTPFKFETNLTGMRADKFFGRNGTSVDLQLVDIGNGYALSVIP